MCDDKKKVVVVVVVVWLCILHMTVANGNFDMTDQGQLKHCEQNVFWKLWSQNWTVDNLLKASDDRHIKICIWDSAWQNITTLPTNIEDEHKDQLQDTLVRFSVVSHRATYIQNRQTTYEKHFGEFIEFRLSFP